MNKFEKVSLNQFLNDIRSCAPGLDEETYITMYKQLKLPKRATSGSAGYDFYAPYTFELAPGESIKIPTGIRVLLDNDKFLAIYPRSGLGFKYRLQLDNTTGIIDSDFSHSDNEGHIFVKMTNDTREGKIVLVEVGKAFAQGIIQQYFLTEDDNANGIRNGGFGSTSK